LRLIALAGGEMMRVDVLIKTLQEHYKDDDEIIVFWWGKKDCEDFIDSKISKAQWKIVVNTYYKDDDLNYQISQVLDSSRKELL